MMSIFYFDVRENGRLIVDSAGVELFGVSDAVDCAKSYVRRIEICTEDRRRRAFEIRCGKIVVAKVQFTAVPSEVQRRAS
jgi:hypothetical protein